MAFEDAAGLPQERARLVAFFLESALRKTPKFILKTCCGSLPPLFEADAFLLSLVCILLTPCFTNSW